MNKNIMLKIGLFSIGLSIVGFLLDDDVRNGYSKSFPFAIQLFEITMMAVVLFLSFSILFSCFSFLFKKSKII
jgi:hypothetical protein